MSINFETVKQEIDSNGKAIINLSGKRFLIEEAKKGYKITIKFNFVIRLLIQVVLFIISMLLIVFALQTIAYLLDIILPTSWENENGTSTFISYQGLVNQSAESLWFLYLFVFILLTKLLYKRISRIIVSKKYFKEKQKIINGLMSNNTNDYGLNAEDLINKYKS